MKRISRTLCAGISVIGIAALSLVAPARPASAGFIPDIISFSFYDGEWSPWVSFSDFPGVDLEGATAVIIGLPTPNTPTPDCVDITRPTGTRQNFTYSVDGNECVGVDAVSVAETLPLAWFVWIPISNGVPYSYIPCWDVRGTSSTEGDYATSIRFTETLFSGSMAAESVSDLVASIVGQMNAIGAESESYATHDRLYGVPYVPYYLGIDPIDPTLIGDLDPEDLVWAIGVSIRACGTGSDQDLLEHYRSQAAMLEESALPNTL